MTKVEHFIKAGSDTHSFVYVTSKGWWIGKWQIPGGHTYDLRIPVVEHTYAYSRGLMDAYYFVSG